MRKEYQSTKEGATELMRKEQTTRGQELPCIEEGTQIQTRRSDRSDEDRAIGLMAEERTIWRKERSIY